MDWRILGKTALFYSIVTIYLGLRPRINKIPIEIVKELALAVYQIFMARETRSEKQWHPLSKYLPCTGFFPTL